MEYSCPCKLWRLDMTSEHDLSRAMQLTVPKTGNKITMEEVRRNAAARRAMLNKTVGPKGREAVAKLLWKDGKPYNGRGR
jgi:hypothetical protein